VPNLSQQGARRQAYRVVACQAGIAGISALLFLIFAGVDAGFSALVGGGISSIATYYQVRIAFSPRHSGDPKRIARAFYTAEVVKVAAVVALFSLALRWLELALAPMIIGFAATLLVYFVALLLPVSETKDG
jgi:ATP synthase protein I